MAQVQLTPRNTAYIKSLRFMLQWMVIAAASSLISVVLVRTFAFGISSIQSFVPPKGFLIIPIAVCGAVLAAVISRIDPVSRGEGIPSYIRSLRNKDAVLSMKTTLVKLASSFVSLAAWGNGGLVGPLGRVSAGISSNLVGLYHRDTGIRSLRRTGAICALAAVVATVTGSSVGSGIFAVEVIQKRDMRYIDLFPSILSSSMAVLFGRFLPFDISFQLKEVHTVFGLRHLPAFLVTVILTAAGGRLFEIFYGSVSRVMRRDSGRAIEFRFAFAALAAVGITWAVNPLMLGVGRGFLHALFEDPRIVLGRLGGNFPLLPAAVIMILVRGLAVGLTVGSGQSAGFFAPLSQIGMLFGTAAAFAFGFGGNIGDIHLLQVVGLTGLLASSQNVPLAAAVIVTEVFGPHLGFPAAMAAILGFQLNRQHTVYDTTLGERKAPVLPF